MSETQGARILEAARVQAGLTSLELWIRYFELGGNASFEGRDVLPVRRP
jgi:hypothetical protein